MEALSISNYEFYPQLPLYVLFPEQELLHGHDCSDCGNPFLCEGHCAVGNNQQCEECEIASKRVKPSTNRERLLDYLDDQAVIEEVKLRVAQEVNIKPLSLFSSETEASKYESKYSKPVALRWRVRD
jgi:hypothetical protein